MYKDNKRRSLQRRKREAKARLLVMIADVQARVAKPGISEEALQKTIDEAVADVRREKASHPTTR
jgi:hypothetical protein